MYSFAVTFTHFPISAAAAAAKSLQSCPTLCDPVDCSPPGSSVSGILQATGAGCHALLQEIFGPKDGPKV